MLLCMTASLFENKFFAHKMGKTGRNIHLSVCYTFLSGSIQWMLLIFLHKNILPYILKSHKGRFGMQKDMSMQGHAQCSPK